MGFAFSQLLIHCSFECVEGSIPAIHSEPRPFILNSLQLRRSFEASESHNRFNELHLRSDVPTLCSDLYVSVPIDGSAVAASV